MSVKPKDDTPAAVTDLNQEIDAAVDAAMTNIDSERKRAEPVVDAEPDLPPPEVLDGDDDDPDKGLKGSDDDPDPDPEPLGITDEDVERAIRAGLTTADAKAFASPEALQRVCERLESAAGGGKKDDDDDGDAAPAAADDDDDEIDLSEVPDLDPDVYDEEIVKGFGAFKKLIARQNAVIRGLKTGGTTAWLEGQAKAMGDEYAKAIGVGIPAPSAEQSAKRAALERKIKVLEAGYKAAGESVDRSDVFGEAASLVLKDVSENIESDKLTDALKRRQNARISRPGSTRTKPTEADADPAAAVAAELDKKYFGK